MEEIKLKNKPNYYLNNITELKQPDTSKTMVDKTKHATSTTYNLFYQTDTKKVPLAVQIDSLYGKIKKDLFGQLFLKLSAELKIGDITDKIKEKIENMNMEKCNKCQDFNKVKLFTGESLKLYAVWYLKDIVVNFRNINEVYCMKIYLDNALLMKEKRT